MQNIYYKKRELYYYNPEKMYITQSVLGNVLYDIIYNDVFHDYIEDVILEKLIMRKVI